MDRSQFMNLTKQLEQYRNKKERTKGAIQSLKQNLSEKYGVSTLKEAKLLLKSLREKLGLEKQEVENLLSELKEEFGEEFEV